MRWILQYVVHWCALSKRLQLNSETRARLNYPRGPFKRALKENIESKHEAIRISTAEEEALRAAALRPKFGTFS